MPRIGIGGLLLLLLAPNFVSAAWVIGGKPFERSFTHQTIEVWSDRALITQEINVLKRQVDFILEQKFLSGVDKTWLPDIAIGADFERAGFWDTDFKSPRGRLTVGIRSSQNLATEPTLQTLVHEFYHIFHYGIRPEEESWMKEGLAVQAEYFAIHKFNPSYQVGSSRSDISLISDTDLHHLADRDGAEVLVQYGRLALFFHYLHRLCGGEKLFDVLTRQSSAKTGISFLRETLPEVGVCKDLDDIFRKFSMALHRPKYNSDDGFILSRLQPPPILEGAPELPPWSSAVFRLKADDTCGASDITWGKAHCIRIRLD